MASKNVLTLHSFWSYLSLRMKTRICRLIKQHYPGIQLQVISRSPKGIQSFFHLNTAFQQSFTHLLFTNLSALAAMPCTLEKQPVT